MKLDSFDGLLGDVYQVTVAPGESMELVLHEAGDLKPPPESAPESVRHDPFFLVIQGLGGAEGYIEGDKEKGVRYYVAVN